MSLLIYGANGYTGELIARRARQKGVATALILAGRRAGKVTALAAELGFEARCFGLEDAAQIERGLVGVKAVLHCAGPFVHTALPMVEACLRMGVHYLDITGEIPVLEAIARRDEQAKARGVTLLPASGFDVVPSDCLATEAKRRLPSATHLDIGFRVPARMSRGTAITTIERAHLGGVVRRDGALRNVPSGFKTRTMDFGDGPEQAITIPWGDVATAYYSTGIPNIEAYAAVPLLSRVGLRLARFLGPILESAALKQFLIAQLDEQSRGPNAEQRGRTESRFFAEVRDELGGLVRLRLITPEGYELTSWTALELALRAERGQLPIGYHTPATACGPGFVLEFEGVRLETVEPEASAEPNTAGAAAH
ncbi:MAG TPA: saccharopine dehydrogenase NADP-binding domain-containing protein [Polyangiaceae bacterium]|nr:saccharopine dehydrogenase NADP-binding domain-containing protein [Polyangiaceae bacterium]